MKRIVLYALLCAVGLLWSCRGSGFGEDLIWDFTNYSVDFYLSDARTGANLLDPATEGNILNEQVWVEYGGKRYEMGADEGERYGEADTRMNMPRPMALRIMQYDYVWSEASQSWKREMSWHLEFGEISPEWNLHGEEFTIFWGDGSSNRVRLDCYITWKSSKNPKVTRSLWLDGREQKEDWTCRIVR